MYPTKFLPVLIASAGLAAAASMEVWGKGGNKTYPVGGLDFIGDDGKRDSVGTWDGDGCSDIGYGRAISSYCFDRGSKRGHFFYSDSSVYYDGKPMDRVCIAETSEVHNECEFMSLIEPCWTRVYSEVQCTW